MTGRSVSEPYSPEMALIESAEPLHYGRRPASSAVELGTMTADELSGVSEDDMPRRSRQRKLGTTGGSPRRSRTARASGISLKDGEVPMCRQWGGWGRLSDEGTGQNNPSRSEDPWGRAARPLERR